MLAAFNRTSSAPVVAAAGADLRPRRGLGFDCFAIPCVCVFKDGSADACEGFGCIFGFELTFPPSPTVDAFFFAALSAPVVSDPTASMSVASGWTTSLVMICACSGRCEEGSCVFLFVVMCEFVFDAVHDDLMAVAIVARFAVPEGVSAGGPGEGSGADLLLNLALDAHSVRVEAGVIGDTDKRHVKWWSNDGFSKPGLLDCKSATREDGIGSNTDAGESL